MEHDQVGIKDFRAEEDKVPMELFQAEVEKQLKQEIRRKRKITQQAHENAPSIWERALVGAIEKLDPRVQIKNPVMFMVLVGTVLTAMLTGKPDLFGPSNASMGYNAAITVILLATVLFANFAEALAEGRGKAQADSLRKTKTDVMAKVIREGGTTTQVPASSLRKGDIVRVEKGDIIPNDGEVIEGVASVDESAITGESAPVLKEPGTDISSSVTGGTKIISDWLLIRVTSDPGQSFLDRMIALVEGAKRQKTPNEIALTVLLSVLTLIFLLVVITLAPMASYLGMRPDPATLIALLVCLIPTTIGALLSAIGIAGMDRVAKFNVIAMSGKAVEAAGDVQTLILDKTGTITIGNRQATEFIPISKHAATEVTQAALISSWFDSTPEGKSIVALALGNGVKAPDDIDRGEGIDFSAETRMSGMNMPDGVAYRKGAVDSIAKYVKASFSVDDAVYEAQVREMKAAAGRVAGNGATPLAIAVSGDIVGVIALSDIVKKGMPERFAHMRSMGIKTIMCTGDNPITAKVIAEQAGVDDFVAEAKPEDKIRLIQAEQAEGKLVAMTGDGTNDAPALSQADVGLAMNSGTAAAKEAANMIDLDSDPSKLIDVVAIGKQLLITRGALTTFSIANDVAKYFAILPAMFMIGLPGLAALNVMHLATPQSAIVSALVFNALIIPALIPLALKGVKFRPVSADALLRRNVLIYGLGGLIVPFIGIKLIDLVVSLFI